MESSPLLGNPSFIAVIRRITSVVASLDIKPLASITVFTTLAALQCHILGLLWSAH